MSVSPWRGHTAHTQFSKPARRACPALASWLSLAVALEVGSKPQAPSPGKVAACL